MNQNVKDLENNKKQSSKTNNKKSLQQTDKENDSDKKENSVNPRQRERKSSDDTITNSDATIFIQKSESSKTKENKAVAVADKAESNTSFEPIDIQKSLLHQKIWIVFCRFAANI